jgi:hypothetical protein
VSFPESGDDPRSNWIGGEFHSGDGHKAEDAPVAVKGAYFHFLNLQAKRGEQENRATGIRVGVGIGAEIDGLRTGEIVGVKVSISLEVFSQIQTSSRSTRQ